MWGAATLVGQGTKYTANADLVTYQGMRPRPGPRARRALGAVYFRHGQPVPVVPGVPALVQAGLGTRIDPAPAGLGRTWTNLPCCHWKTNAAAAPFSPSASNFTGPWTLLSWTPLCR